ncbi:hypothetical protein XENTR_v10002927 [Xenopus tropicalis]|nr:hypothetical protein XENTR_v10002927 [Xenopus tropicalis]
MDCEQQIVPYSLGITGTSVILSQISVSKETSVNCKHIGKRHIFARLLLVEMLNERDYGYSVNHNIL